MQMCPDELLLSEDPNIFVGSLLLHFDSGVSRACSHALQRVVTEQQHIRYRLMEGILNLILRLEAESHQLYTLVDNVRQLLTEVCPQRSCFYLSCVFFCTSRTGFEMMMISSPQSIHVMMEEGILHPFPFFVFHVVCPFSHSISLN